MTSPSSNAPSRPARRKKCHAEADNVPGWLRVETYLMAEPACTVTPAGAVHRIDVTSDSLLPYEVEITCDCVSAAFGYDNGGTQESRWAVTLAMPSRPAFGDPQPERAERKIRAGAVSGGGRIELTPRWQCVTHPGRGDMDSLSIHVDTTA